MKPDKKTLKSDPAGTNLLLIFSTLFDFLQHFVFCIGFVVLSLSHETKV